MQSYNNNRRKPGPLQNSVPLDLCSAETHLLRLSFIQLYFHYPRSPLVLIVSIVLLFDLSHMFLLFSVVLFIFVRHLKQRVT